MGGKTTKQPLLYIDQPLMDKPNAFMQENYSSLTNRKNAQEKPIEEEHFVQPIRRRFNPFFDTVEYDEFDLDHFSNGTSDGDEEGTESDKNDAESPDDNVKFNDLTIQGKIDYFTQLPNEMPRIRCEVEIGDNVYRGHILNDNGDEITMHTGRATRSIQ